MTNMTTHRNTILLTILASVLAVSGLYLEVMDYQDENSVGSALMVAALLLGVLAYAHANRSWPHRHRR